MKKTLLLLLIPFSSCAAEFPAPYNSEADRSGPMAASEAAAKMQLPPGFKATVFAAEPDVQNPIALSWDSRGRLWVAENYTYAESGKRFDLNLRDRILIFEDKDGDGRAGHSGGAAHPAARLALAISPAAQSRRVVELWNHQSLGTRLGRARRTVLHQHGQWPSLARLCRRALRPPAHH